MAVRSPALKFRCSDGINFFPVFRWPVSINVGPPHAVAADVINTPVSFGRKKRLNSRCVSIQARVGSW
jgi:hypothetical protein